MCMTRKGHTHWKVIEGGKPLESSPDHFTVRLRQEQAKHETARSLTPEEIEALHAADRDKV